MNLSNFVVSFTGPLWLGMVVPDRVLFMGQIEHNCIYAKLNYLKWNCF